VPGGFQEAWEGLDLAARRALELAYASLAGGGLAVGAVITDAGGKVVAEGRNRAYDPPGGVEALQATPLAHAEMNAFAAVPTGRDLGDCALLSTQEPCSMCAAAARFLGVGTVRYLAPDPWALASGQTPDDDAVGPAADLWVVTANLMFLLGIASSAGVEHPTVVANGELEPETTQIVRDMVSDGLVVPAITRGKTLADVLTSRWPRITTASADRATRTGFGEGRPSSGV
jgi:tRNA(Arg) A34 adenosine deaminase TadA